MADKQLWSGDNARRITRRIIVECDLVLQTPALFGTGDHDLITDMPLLVDAYDGVTPVLTGASLTGALRAYLWARERGYRVGDPTEKPPDDLTEKPPDEKPEFCTELLFGGFKGHDGGLQSALIVDDAFGTNFGVETRDGVRIEAKTRTAASGNLFDMQVWRAGTTFPLRLELLLANPRRDMGSDYHLRLKQGLAIALAGLTDGGITLGGRKKRGFGRITTHNWRIKAYDLTSTSGLCDWLKHGHIPLAEQQLTPTDDPLEHPEFGFEALIDQRHRFRMEAEFVLDGSLLIRSAGRPNSISPDMVHLTNHEGKPIISGTSITGALRSRSRRILNLFHDDETTRQRINDLFGVFGAGEDASASRLIVEETLIEQPQFELVQNRVAIDRFTGGAKDSALFNEQPVFGKRDKKGTLQTRLRVNLTIRNPQKRDIGLMLLLLKDLWVGDLPLGGEVSVGRGRLAGRVAQIHYRHHHDDKWQTEAWCLEHQQGRIKVEGVAPQRLEQEFVSAVSRGATR